MFHGSGLEFHRKSSPNCKHNAPRQTKDQWCRRRESDDPQINPNQWVFHTRMASSEVMTNGYIRTFSFKKHWCRFQGMLPTVSPLANTFASALFRNHWESNRFTLAQFDTNSVSFRTKANEWYLPRFLQCTTLEVDKDGSFMMIASTWMRHNARGWTAKVGKTYVRVAHYAITMLDSNLVCISRMPKMIYGSLGFVCWSHSFLFWSVTTRVAYKCATSTI